MTDVHIAVHRGSRIGTVEPALHGHFSEHLGRCVYDGLWHDVTGDDQGPREDVVSLLAALDVPVLRWPGGCFADDYHWEDGVGPRDQRPRRRNLFWAQGREQVPEEPNAFGTDEFLRLCDRLDADPYLAVNVGSGDPQEATDWVEYCCYGGDTELTARRRENGREEPYSVPYWGLGNENWGCGGRMSPEQYAREYRRYATYVGQMDGLMVDDDLELVACGFENNEWNRRFLEEVADAVFGVEFPLDHLTLHHYYGRTMSVPDADADQYDRFLAAALEMESHVERIAAAIDAAASTRDIGVIVDEWGAWHTEAVAETGLEQPGTVLDALSAAAVLDVFNRHSDVMAMANIAQTVNVLQCVVETDGDDAWPRPTYRVFDLYAPHRGSEAVRTSVETPTRATEDGELPLVGASASVDESGTYVTVTNLDCRAAHTVEVDLGDAAVNDAEARVLFADQDPDRVVDADNADEFAADPLETATDGGTLTVDLPSATVAGVAVE